MVEFRQSKKIKAFVDDHFLLATSILSVILSLLYIWKGLREGFLIGTWIVVALNFLYAPLSLFFKRKLFTYYFLVYSLVMVFVLAFDKTFLFNNFTSLFLLCFVIILNPKLEFWGIVSYFLAVFVAFILNEENLIHFFIHFVRSLWFVILLSVVLKNRYEKKRLILFNDEKEILDQLCDGAVYQKEVRGFSENTVYRKLKAARERNGGITREELVETYRKEKMEE